MGNAPCRLLLPRHTDFFAHRYRPLQVENAFPVVAQKFADFPRFLVAKLVYGSFCFFRKAHFLKKQNFETIGGKKE